MSRRGFGRVTAQRDTETAGGQRGDEDGVAADEHPNPHRAVVSLKIRREPSGPASLNNYAKPSGRAGLADHASVLVTFVKFRASLVRPRPDAYQFPDGPCAPCDAQRFPSSSSRRVRCIRRPRSSPPRAGRHDPPRTSPADRLTSAAMENRSTAPRARRPATSGEATKRLPRAARTSTPSCLSTPETLSRLPQQVPAPLLRIMPDCLEQMRVLRSRYHVLSDATAEWAACSSRSVPDQSALTRLASARFAPARCAASRFAPVSFASPSAPRSSPLRAGLPQPKTPQLGPSRPGRPVANGC